MDIFEQPRALLIGDKGQIGWELLRSLAPIVRLDSVDYPCLDLSDGSAIQRYICRIAPDVIVNAAAYTNVKQAEDEPEEAKKINEIAPGVIAKEAKKLGALLVHYSTDFIFDGEKRQPYVEDDIPNPLNVYGQTKLGGDRAIQETGCRHLIFRTCWVYGIRGSNFMLTMLNLANNNESRLVLQDM